VKRDEDVITIDDVREAIRQFLLSEVENYVDAMEEPELLDSWNRDRGEVDGLEAQRMFSLFLIFKHWKEF